MGFQYHNNIIMIQSYLHNFIIIGYGNYYTNGEKFGAIIIISYNYYSFNNISTTTYDD